MNIPNMITTARLVLTALVFVCLEFVHGRSGSPYDLTPDQPILVWTAFALFLVAAITDFLDGYLARKWNMVTAFGRIADPFADKVLITGTLIMLLRFPELRFALTNWYVVVVVAREFLVTAIRGFVESTGTPFPADRLGKYKMIAQCVHCSALLTLLAGTDLFYWFAVVGFWVSLVLTAVSGLNYVWKARAIVLAGAAG